MDHKKIEALATDLKTEAALNKVFKALKQKLIEVALDAELKAHLGYSKHERTTVNNARNGFLEKKDLQPLRGAEDQNAPRSHRLF